MPTARDRDLQKLKRIFNRRSVASVKKAKLKSVFYGVRRGPSVAETATPNIPNKNRDWDVFTELLSQRTIRLDGEVDDDSAAAVIAAIRYLENKDPKKPIHLEINSPGGYVTDGLAIIDTMYNCRCPIYTYVYGQAASMASLILCVGNKRYAAPNAEIMIHQPLGGAEGQQTEIEIRAKEIRETRVRMVDIYAKETGRKHEYLDRLIERDNTLTPEKAKRLGLIDAVLTQEAYFKIHKRKVPEHKKPRYPANIRTTPVKGIDQHFDELLEMAVTGKPANDTGDPKPRASRRKKKAPRQP